MRFSDVDEHHFSASPVFAFGRRSAHQHSLGLQRWGLRKQVVATLIVALEITGHQSASNVNVAISAFVGIHPTDTDGIFAGLLTALFDRYFSPYVAGLHELYLFATGCLKFL